jgi:regulator of protease activity HflC (stomatin/prohibitin superfamily)
MDLDESLSSRERINLALKKVLDQASSKWGLEIKRVELRNIKPPEDVQHAMEKQMQAERERRAAVLQAEGKKQSEILKSEGVRQALIAESEGERQALIQRAEGESQAIEKVAQARAKALELLKREIGDNSMSYQVASAYIEAFKNLAGQSDKVVFMPYESSALISSLGVLKTLFKEDSSMAGKK